MVSPIYPDERKNFKWLLKNLEKLWNIFIFFIFFFFLITAIFYILLPIYFWDGLFLLPVEHKWEMFSCLGKKSLNLEEGAKGFTINCGENLFVMRKYSPYTDSWTLEITLTEQGLWCYQYKDSGFCQYITE